MTFYTYMMRNYRGKRSPKGDLADDMFLDRETFPRNRNVKFDGGYTILRDYLEEQHACQECLIVFEQCWTEYVTFEKLKKMTKKEK